MCEVRVTGGTLPQEEINAYIDEKLAKQKKESEKPAPIITPVFFPASTIILPAPEAKTDEKTDKPADGSEEKNAEAEKKNEETLDGKEQNEPADETENTESENKDEK